MCEWATYEEGYWTVCWAWIVPYPCKKYRTVTKWCCFFSWIKETGWGVFSTLEGCANGQLYKWNAFSFNFFGSHYYYNITKCFGSEKSSSGNCTPLGIGHAFEQLIRESGRSGGK